MCGKAQWRLQRTPDHQLILQAQSTGTQRSIARNRVHGTNSWSIHPGVQVKELTFLPLDSHQEGRVRKKKEKKKSKVSSLQRLMGNSSLSVLPRPTLPTPLCLCLSCPHFYVSCPGNESELKFATLYLHLIGVTCIQKMRP